jgi:hypothetical protein
MEKTFCCPSQNSIIHPNYSCNHNISVVSQYYFIIIANNTEGPWGKTTYCDGGKTFDPLLVDKTTNP